jgi:hypothetical protein
MNWMRYFLGLGNVAASLALAILMLALCAIYNENLLLALLDYAADVRKWLVSFKGWPKAELIARFVLHESSILLMFFTLFARAILGLFTGLVAWLAGH